MKRKRIYREDREASITPKLLRQLLVVAAHTGFLAGQRKIKADMVEAYKREAANAAT